MIHSKNLAEEAAGVYESGKEFAYDHVMLDKVVPIVRDKDTRINIKVNAQRRSMKGILLLFVVPYTAGTRDSEKYIFPDLKKIGVTINVSPNMLYNNGIETGDIWAEVGRFFMKEKYKPQHMTLEKFYTDNKFGLTIQYNDLLTTPHGGFSVTIQLRKITMVSKKTKISSKTLYYVCMYVCMNKFKTRTPLKGLI